MARPGFPFGMTVPDCVGMVPRRRLTDVFSRIAPSLSAISAPAAYGKSVLAAQLASEWGKGPAIWVSLPGGCSSDAQIMSAILERISPGARASARRTPGLVESPAFVDLLDSVQNAIRESVGPGTCLVLDNLAPDASEALKALAEIPQASASAVDCVVATIRQAPGTTPSIGAWWGIDASELLLDDDEAASLARQFLGDIDDQSLDRLLQASGRQAGLFSVLAKCAASHPVSIERLRRPHPQIRILLEGLAASQLDHHQVHLLQVMGLLGQGTASDLELLQPGFASAELTAVGEALPLVSVGDSMPNRTFRVHEIAQRTFASPAALWDRDRDAFNRLAQMLEERGDAARALEMVVDAADTETVRRWTRSLGRRLLEAGFRDPLDRAFARIGAIELIDDPQLLVLKAAAELDQGRAEDARRSAQVALDIAQYAGDQVIVADALVTLSQVEAALGAFVLSRSYADRAAGLCAGLGDAGLEAQLRGRRLLMSSLIGDADSYLADKQAAFAAVARSGQGRDDEAPALVSFFAGTACGALNGEWSESVGMLEAACRSSKLAFGVRASAMHNLSDALLQTGRVDRAASTLQALQDLLARGSATPPDTGQCLTTGLRATRGETKDLLEETCEACARFWSEGQRVLSISSATSGSTAMLGNRMFAGALTAAEQAAGCATELGAAALEWPAQLSRAAALAALGDWTRAQTLAQGVHDIVAERRVRGVHFQADTILAAASAQLGDAPGAAARLTEHNDFFLSESANWQVAMYVRALPVLLGPLTLSVGAAQLPVHMLQLILPQYAEEAVAAAVDCLPPDELELLSMRLLGRRVTGRRATDRAGARTCRVALFGGLHIEIGERVVQDSEWRKRKARLLFAMLASRCGKDIPRDQLTDYLWPEMNEDQALNNLYVVWSSMKHVLVPGSKRGDKCVYVEHRGGVCRAVSGQVQTDLDEFDEQLVVAAKARSAGDEAAEMDALRRVAEIYRGELLPGEAYDDWFSGLRERCRHDFEDAMLRAASLLEARGDLQGGLGLLRRALQNDPWREDLYQAALRLQILSGQRSAAIETYLTCRSRLVEDLGIDPSLETTRLYEQVLGMEDRPFGLRNAASKKKQPGTPR